MFPAPEQKRAFLLIWNAVFVAILAWEYEHYEPGVDGLFLYHRRISPLVTFALLVARFTNYGIHVVNHGSRVYCLDPATAEFRVNSEIYWYKIFLIGSHVVLLVDIAVEVLVGAELAIFVDLGLIWVLQVAETWAHWVDLSDEKMTMRPGSPQTMV